MSNKFQNEDFKSKAELEAKGGSKAQLLNDTKIYVTSLDSTLDEAIATGQIGGGGSGGGGAVGLKARAFTMTDGSLAEHNVQPPVVNANGFTQLTLDFEVKTQELMRVFIDGKKIPLFINSSVTPGPFYKRIDNYNIELDKNYSTSALPVEIEVYSSAELPEVVPSILAGLAVKYEGTFVTTDTTKVSFDGTYTKIELGFTVSQNDVGMVFIDGAFATPDVSLGLANSWKLVDHNTLALLGNHTLASKHVYVAFFEGSSQVDTFGNVNLTLRAKLSQIILEDASLQKWSLKVSHDGELEILAVTSGVPDPVRIYKDNGEPVGLTVVDGQLQAIHNPTPGLIFDPCFLGADNGMAWKLKSTNANELYLIDGEGNKWNLKDQLGNVIYRIEQTVHGAVHHTKAFPTHHDLPQPPQQITGNVPFTFVLENGETCMKIWDTFSQTWLCVEFKKPDDGDRFPLGTVLNSFLTEKEFLAEMKDVEGKRWRLLNGTNIEGSDLAKLKKWNSIPNGQGMFLRGNDNGSGVDQDYVHRQKHDGDYVGSFQNFDWKGFHMTNTRHNTFDYTHGPQYFGKAIDHYVGNLFTGYWYAPGAAIGMMWDHSEPRPKNISVNYFVKYNR